MTKVFRGDMVVWSDINCMIERDTRGKIVMCAKFSPDDLITVFVFLSGLSTPCCMRWSVDFVPQLIYFEPKFANQGTKPHPFFQGFWHRQRRMFLILASVPYCQIEWMERACKLISTLPRSFQDRGIYELFSHGVCDSFFLPFLSIFFFCSRPISNQFVPKTQKGK